MTKSEKQPIPSESNCPYCGGAPTDESQAEHRLSNLGYIHDDIGLRCSDCEQEWWCGVPIGSWKGGEDLFCTSCDARFMRVHRVAVNGAGDGYLMLHLKCPNPDCYYFKTVTRSVDANGVSLVGYPDITGSMDGADAWGYEDEKKPGEA